MTLVLLFVQEEAASQALQSFQTLAMSIAQRTAPLHIDMMQTLANRCAHLAVDALEPVMFYYKATVGYVLHLALKRLSETILQKEKTNKKGNIAHSYL